MTKAQALVAIQFTLFGMMTITLLGFPPQTIHPLLRLIGLGLAIAGPIFGIIAILEHARSNATLPKVVPTPNASVPLVRSGLYSRIRHPIYTGVLMTVTGAALAHGHIVNLCVALILVIFFTFKSRYEESLLRMNYPDYAAYSQESGRFLPRLRK